MNSAFNVNMAALSNSSLKKRLSAISFEEASKDFNCFIAKSGDYALAKKNFPYDDIENPVQSVIDTCKNTITAEPQKTDFIVIYGLGLGYILDEVYTRYNSRIIVFEPDLQLLRFVMENVDLSHILSDPRVYISNNCEECCLKIAEHYLSHDKIDILYLKNYGLIKPKELILLSNMLFNTCKSKIADINSIKVISKAWVKNIINNITSYRYIKPLYSLDNCVTGGTALILAAGPSLLDNIEQIKANRDKFVIFAISKTLSTLQQHGIVPDFAVFADAINRSDLNSLSSDFISKTKIIADIKTDNIIYSKKWKDVYFYFSNNTEFVNKLANKGLIKTYPAVGTTTINALMCASLLGFKKIAVCGFDLAFRDNIAYCDSTSLILKDNKAQINDYSVDTTLVKSVTGDMVRTRVDYANFIPQCENNLRLINTGTEIFNITDFGAYIRGMTYTVLQKVISDEKSNLNEIINNTSIQRINLCGELDNEVKNMEELREAFSSTEINFTKIYALKKSSLLSEYTRFDLLQLVQGDFTHEQLSTFVNTILASIDELKGLIKGNLVHS